MKAIVMLSGGMDSAVTLAEAVKKYGASEVLAVTFLYGQRHVKEVDAAIDLTAHYDVESKLFVISLRQIGGSALTDDINVPDGEATTTYVPIRNTIFLSICAAIAEVVGADEIWTGFNYIDSGGYPDTTPDYVNAMNAVLAVGSRKKPKVIAPLINLTKADIVRRGVELGVPFEKTWSCYKGLDKPCGKCNSCINRKKGFDEAGVVDPLGTVC